MAGAGPYLYVNVTEATLTIPRHDQTGSRVVRPGEGFYGPAFYDRFVLQGILARQHAELVTVYGIVTEADLIPNDTAHAGYFNGIYWDCPPWRFQRKAVEDAQNYNHSLTVSALGQVKYSISFALTAQADDPMSITYYFYTSAVNPLVPTFKIQRTEILGSNWSYPDLEDLPSNFYSLPPQDQHLILLRRSTL